MKIRTFSFALALILSTHPFSSVKSADFLGAYDQSSGQSSSIPASVFEDCKFDFTDTKSITHLPPPPQGWGMHDSNGCAISLKGNGFITLGLADISLIIAQKKDSQLDQLTTSTGFQKSTDGTWKFKGNPLGAGEFTSFKKLSHQEMKNGADITLVGRQIQTGKDQAGTPLTFEGVQILRIDPDFLVSVGMAFDTNTPTSKRDEIVKDLTTLVNSVHALPSAEATSPKASQ